MVTTAIHSSCSSTTFNRSTYIRPSIASTVIVLDWDDTLFPNSHLSRKNYPLEEGPFVLAFEDQQMLDTLVKYIATFLASCIEANRTCIIITNGEDGWVQTSCERFMPSLLPFLQNIQIVSARTAYEEKYPIDEWKTACFTVELAKIMGHQSNPHQHVISIGDSHYERQALKAFSNKMPLAKTKSVKFLHVPSMVDLCRQVKLIQTYLSHLCTHPGHLDLVLSHDLLRTVTV
ncbi:hypothetical protein THRCLA_05910 [Thraustotheca clavata]|uniref:Uncharacterized protein n=1 Tax=Thraustotheca clavata TaxID=74557 RepID=A0A1V9ZRE0_9STRA|nr:hypothetical protein THRCLA_05910 [Thraustotheca clavata]